MPTDKTLLSENSTGLSSNPGDQGEPYPATGQPTIDAPQYNEAGTKLELEKRSVKTIGHAWNICTATEQSNRQRALRTADIQELHDGAPPRSATQNAEKGKSWQANASTGWMSGIVGRVAQRFVNAVISQVYVTASALPKGDPTSKTKTDLMRAKMTKLLRSWDGNTGLINSLAVETVLQGYCYAVFLDPYTYKPTMFKQDRAFCPELAGQHARQLQFFVAKMDYRLDEFLEPFMDGGDKAADEIGYDIKNCLEAANTAQIADPRDDATTTQFRNFAEMQNEGVLGLTYTNTGARVVKCWILFNREYDGQLSFWLIARDTGKLLRFSFKLFNSMEDALAMFSFEPGNGCIHSSKGLGRKLANLTVVKELFRNGIIDNARVSGLMVLRIDSKDKSKFSPTVMSPFMMLDKSVDIPQEQFMVNAEPYKVVDTLIDAWAEQSVGAYLTNQINDDGRTEKTATEAQIDSRRETEAADIQIRRWLDQQSNMIQIQQQRAFSEDAIKRARRIWEKINSDPVADVEKTYGTDKDERDWMRTLVEVMQNGISDDEIKQFRDSPVSIFAHVSDAAVQAGISAAVQKYAGNPNVDQPILILRDLEGMVGAEAARSLWIPNADQTVVAEATRLQIMESVLMEEALIAMPVSIRDNHMVHGINIQQILTNKYAPILSQPNPDQRVMKAVELIVNHLGDHLNFELQLGLGNQKPFQQLQKFYEGFKKQVEQVVKINAQAAAAQTAVTDRLRAEGAASPDGLAGPEAPPANQATATPAPAAPAQPPLESSSSGPVFSLPAAIPRTSEPRAA